MMRWVNSPIQIGKCRLHPLIYTFPSEISAQDVGKKKAEPKTPHFLSLNQDIVAGYQKRKCRLKYVIHTPRARIEKRKKTAPVTQLCCSKNKQFI